MVCESKIVCGIEIGRLNGTWKEVDKIHSKFYKRLIGIQNYAANGFAEVELDRESRRGKC